MGMKSARARALHGRLRGHHIEVRDARALVAREREVHGVLEAERTLRASRRCRADNS
jgi:hypothetical protein